MRLINMNHLHCNFCIFLRCKYAYIVNLMIRNEDVIKITITNWMYLISKNCFFSHHFFFRSKSKEFQLHSVGVLRHITKMIFTKIKSVFGNHFLQILIEPLSRSLDSFQQTKFLQYSMKRFRGVAGPMQWHISLCSILLHFKMK